MLSNYIFIATPQHQTKPNSSIKPAAEFSFLVTWHLTQHLTGNLTQHLTGNLIQHLTQQWHDIKHIYWYFSWHPICHLTQLPTFHLTWHLKLWWHDILHYIMKEYKMASDNILTIFSSSCYHIDEWFLYILTFIILFQYYFKFVFLTYHPSRVGNKK